jgi:hypothetical protein
MGVTRRSDVRVFNQGSQGLILQSDIVHVGPPTPTVGWRLAVGVGGLDSSVSPCTNLNNPTKKSNRGIGDRTSLFGQRFATLLENSSLAAAPANGGGLDGLARWSDSFPRRCQLTDPAIGEACRLCESIDLLIH